MMKVLLVDDEPLVLIGMQSMLNWAKLGLEIVGTARNGADAWTIVQGQHPDIVICDVMMPVMSGLDLAEKCREVDTTLPVFIMLTSYEEFEYAKRSLRLGAVEYLVKMDLTPELLENALHRAIERVKKRAGPSHPGGHRRRQRSGAVPGSAVYPALRRSVPGAGLL
ncbi:MAG: response regulator [Clostridiales bacterium]|nr:response regulator [Clostridiales bacterium]